MYLGSLIRFWLSARAPGPHAAHRRHAQLVNLPAKEELAIDVQSGLLESRCDQELVRAGNAWSIQECPGAYRLSLLRRAFDPEGTEVGKFFGPIQAGIHGQTSGRSTVYLLGADRPKIARPLETAKLLIIRPGRELGQQAKAGKAPGIGHFHGGQLAAVLKQSWIKRKLSFLAILNEHEFNLVLRQEAAMVEFHPKGQGWVAPQGAFMPKSDQPVLVVRQSS